MTIPAPPDSDGDLPRFLDELGVAGIVDAHTHFLPERMLAKVWAFFAAAQTHYGTAWPIEYQLPEPDRVAVLEKLRVRAYAPLVYPHKAGMASWLIEWVTEFAARTPAAVPTATMFPEPGVAEYVGKAVAAGARIVKVHVQVGGFDPRDELLRPAWGLLAEAGVPAMVHCGHGPIPGAFTGLDVIADVLAAHPRLPLVLAHAGMPDYAAALELVHRYDHVILDTTMVGTAFSEALAPLPPDWPARLVGIENRIVFGTDFPNIPYPYAQQVAAVAGWAARDDRLGAPFLRAVLHDNPARLLRL